MRPGGGSGGEWRMPRRCARAGAKRRHAFGNDRLPPAGRLCLGRNVLIGTARAAWPATRLRLSCSEAGFRGAAPRGTPERSEGRERDPLSMDGFTLVVPRWASAPRLVCVSQCTCVACNEIILQSVRERDPTLGTSRAGSLHTLSVCCPVFPTVVRSRDRAPGPASAHPAPRSSCSSSLDRREPVVGRVRTGINKITSS